MWDPQRSGRIGLLILAATSLGCGASASGGADVRVTTPPESCAMVSPCGGDLTGTWKVLGGCVDALFFNGLLTCPPNTREVVGLDYSGTVTFNADMTYTTTSLAEHGAAPYDIPSACLPGGVTCSDISPSCTGADSCTCATRFDGTAPLGGSGSYTFFGNEVIFHSKSGTSIEGIYYCVAGAELHLSTWATIYQSDGTRITPVTSDLVAQLQ